MAGNRKAAEAIILEGINDLCPGSPNVAMWKGVFESMSDKAFDDLMKGIEDGSVRLPFIQPNLDSKFRLSIDRNLALAKKLNHEFFERLWINTGNDIPPYLSNEKYLVVDLPLKRQAQLLTKKISIPHDNRSVDDFTGQPTGGSKGSKLSYPEIGVLASLDMNQCLRELLKTRGGDVESFNAMNTMISRTGSVSMDAIADLGGVVKSTQTLSTYLSAMHLQNTLLS